MKTNETMVEELSQNPWESFSTWLNIAKKTNLPNPNAMVLSTVEDHIPHSRIVLLKEYSEKNGLVFFTNYTSAKAEQISKNNNVCLLFFWDILERQIRIYGQLHKVSLETSKQYFSTRPKDSQIGAWASKQSKKLINRQELVDRFEKYKEKFASKEVDCPEFWGGYSLKPDKFEFWQGNASRLHARTVYRFKKNNIWEKNLLYP